MGNKKCPIDKSRQCNSCKEKFNCRWSTSKVLTIYTNVDFNNIPVVGLFNRRIRWKMFELSEILTKLIDMLPYALIGIFNGFGTAIGVYFAQKSFIKHMEKIKKWTIYTGKKS